MRTHPPAHDDAWHGSATSPRILIEERDGALAWAEARELERAGYQVAVCDGPDPANGSRCALVEHGRCHLAEQADLVLCNVDSSARADMVLDRLRADRADRPILRVAGPQDLQRDADFLGGVTTLPFPLFKGELTAAVDEALAQS